jgi:hypothetical protein
MPCSNIRSLLRARLISCSGDAKSLIISHPTSEVLVTPCYKGLQLVRYVILFVHNLVKGLQ